MDVQPIERLLYYQGHSSCGLELHELTTRPLLQKLKGQDPDLEWVSTTPRYCQMVGEAYKEKRLKWCEDQIANSEKFDDLIFTDECSVQLDVHRRKCYRKKVNHGS